MTPPAILTDFKSALLRICVTDLADEWHQHSIATNRRDGQPQENPNQCEYGLKTGFVIDPLANDDSQDEREGEKPPRAEQ